MKTIHFVDIENMCGTGAPAPLDVSRCLDAYQAIAPVKSGDEVYLASAHKSKKLLVQQLDRFKGVSVHVLSRSGQDGADLALLERMSSLLEAQRKPGAMMVRVILGSGDHIFVQVLEELRATGKAKIGIVALDPRHTNTDLLVQNDTKFLTHSGFRGPGVDPTSAAHFESLQRKRTLENAREWAEFVNEVLYEPDPRDFMAYTVRTRDFHGVERTRTFIADGLPVGAKTGTLYAISLESPAWRSITRAKIGDRFSWIGASGRRVEAELLSIAA